MVFFGVLNGFSRFPRGFPCFSLLKPPGLGSPGDVRRRLERWQAQGLGGELLYTGWELQLGA